MISVIRIEGSERPTVNVASFRAVHVPLAFNTRAFTVVVLLIVIGAVLLERHDLALDEVADPGAQRGDIGWQREVHALTHAQHVAAIDHHGRAGHEARGQARWRSP